MLLSYTGVPPLYEIRYYVFDGSTYIAFENPIRFATTGTDNADDCFVTYVILYVWKYFMYYKRLHVFILRVVRVWRIRYERTLHTNTSQT